MTLWHVHMLHFMHVLQTIESFDNAYSMLVFCLIARIFDRIELPVLSVCSSAPANSGLHQVSAIVPMRFYSNQCPDYLKRERVFCTTASSNDLNYLYIYMHIFFSNINSFLTIKPFLALRPPQRIGRLSEENIDLIL